MQVTVECLERASLEGPDSRNKLILFFQYYISTASSGLDEYFLLTEDFALDAEDLQRLVSQRDVVELRLRKLVQDGIRDGSIVECDPKLAVFLLLGAVNWIPKWFSPAGPWSHQQLAFGAAEMLDRMLSTAPSASLTRKIATLKVEPQTTAARSQARGK
jgi:TetR/AcrR family transcriptional regulator